MLVEIQGAGNVLGIVKNCSVPSAVIDRNCLDIRGVEKCFS